MKHGIVISKKKMKLGKSFIKFLGVEIGQGKIKLQEHITQNILKFPDKIEDTKTLRSFLGLLNHARHFIKNLSKIIGPLHSKTSPNVQKYFNEEDIKNLKQVKQLALHLPELNLPLKTDYFIVQTDGCETSWGAILIKKPNKYSQKTEEKICRYSSGKYKEKGNISSIDAELLAIIYALNSFELFLRREFTIRTDCEAIVKFYNKMNEKKSQSRWSINFTTILLDKGYVPNLEHVKGKDNGLADTLSRILTKGA